MRLVMIQTQLMEMDVLLSAKLNRDTFVQTEPVLLAFLFVMNVLLTQIVNNATLSPLGTQLTVKPTVQ